MTPSLSVRSSHIFCSRVYWKLAAFSVAMFAAPLTAYYFSRDRVFGGNPTNAAGFAALIANVVLVAYVIAAFLEDQGDVPASSKATEVHRQTAEAKKDK
jgi:hypothetical protein